MKPVSPWFSPACAISGIRCYAAPIMEGTMKIILPILLLVAAGPALGEPAPGKADQPVTYDRNSRQVLPYDRMPVLCPRSDLTSPGCISAQKPAPEKALKPKTIG